MLNIGRVKWALRKVRLPVSANALVLDVGSGGKPHARADILLDRPGGAEHRCGVPMLMDRPTVFGDAEKLPFKNKAFDFVNASHILEHMERPGAFLNELQRVGKAGYIETPNFLFERLIPYDIHCLELASIRGVLHIHKKSKAVADEFIGALEFLRHDKRWRDLFYGQPHLFHVCHFWEERIQYEIHNPTESCEWINDIYMNSVTSEVTDEYLDGGWRGIGQRTLNYLQRRRRLKQIETFDIRTILACPECKGDLSSSEFELLCESCEVKYPYRPNIDFTSPKAL